MSAAQVREKLHEYINLADDRLIQAMFAMLQNYLQAEEGIVGFTVEGQPLTKQDMLQSLEEAIEAGKGVSTKEARDAKQAWR
jgi:hypothetical protein